MALKTSYIELNKDYQIILDNSGQNSSADNFIQVNHGTAELFFDTDTPSSSSIGLRWSAGARILFVPQGSKLYGRLWKNSDSCSVIVNKDS